MSNRVARHRQQMRSVVGRRDARFEDQIVAGLLAFLAQSAMANPDDRVEPVHGAKHAGRDQHRPVSARDVSDLVTKHDLDPITRPV